MTLAVVAFLTLSLSGSVTGIFQQVETNLFYLPSNEQNLAYRAAALLFDEFGIEEGLSIRLRKFILYQRGWQEEVLMLHPCFTA